MKGKKGSRSDRLPFQKDAISAYRKMAKHVDKINMARRHLDPIEWGQAFKKLLAERGVVRGKGKRNELTSATVAEVADELGVAERTAEQRV